MFSGHLLCFALISLLIQVGEADELQDYSPLNSGQGKTPCQMKSDVESCSGSLERRDAVLVSRSFPSPSQCTCTNVYFNVWSACLLSSGEANSTVQSTNWTDTCQQRGISMTVDQYHSSNSMDLPSWTFISLTPNRTFDIAEALDIASGNSTGATKWNKIQIIVPVVVGVVVSAIFVLGIFIWRSRKTGSPGILPHMRVALSRRFRNGFGTSRIRTGSRDQEWVIDRPSEVNVETVEMVTSASSRRSTGHVRLSSSSSFNLDTVKSGRLAWPLSAKKKLWKNSQVARAVRRTLMFLPVPWKSGPVSVQSISPPRKFEIDASSDRTRTDSTLENFRRGGFRESGTRTETTESALGTSRYDYYSAIYEEDDDDDVDSDLDFGELNVNNEREHLMSNDNGHLDPDAVMIISESGDNFTMRSNSTSSPTHRIPPSPVRPRSNSPVQPIPPPPRTPVREHRRKFSRRAPPAPNYPAPVPSSQSSHRSNRALDKPSIESILQSSATMSSNDVVGVSRHLQVSPPRRRLPLPIPPDEPPLFSDSSPSQHYVSLPPALPTHSAPSYTPQTQTQLQRTPRNNSRPLPSENIVNSDPSVRSPFEYATSHTRNQSVSTSNSNSLPVMSSPPYRSSPLPEEVCIARSDSPPPTSNSSAPPYTVTDVAISQREQHCDLLDRDNTLPDILAPPSPPHLIHHTDNSHHRLMPLPSNIESGDDHGLHFEEDDRVGNIQSGPIGHRGYPFEATISPQTHYRTFSDGSLAPSARHAHNAHEPFVDNSLLYPGAVRAAGLMSSSVNAGSRELQTQTSHESFRSVLSDSQLSDSREI